MLRAPMSSIRSCDIPPGALLGQYLQGGGYADCYATEVGRAVTQAEYVEAFYSTPVFKLERLLLAWFASRPSTDAQARELAQATRSRFAAWCVEARSADQLLLCDFQGRTRSWLMSAAADRGDGGGAPRTRLYFGSAVVPAVSRRTGRSRMGFAFRALLGFHKLYSRVLLRAACARLQRAGPAAAGR